MINKYPMTKKYGKSKHSPRKLDSKHILFLIKLYAIYMSPISKGNYIEREDIHLFYLLF